LNGTGVAFGGANALTEAVIGNGVTRIDGMFQGCTQLERVSLPKSLRTIGEFSFWGCICLSDLVLPDGLISIADHAFDDCRGLETIVIPKSVTDIGFAAFEGCYRLQELTLPVIGSGSQYSHFGSIFGATDFEAQASYIPPDFKKVTVTAGKRLENGAFKGCSTIESIILPDSLEIAAGDAFDYLDNLKYIEFGTGFTNNGYAVGLTYCNKLEKIVFKNNPPTLFFRDSMAFEPLHSKGLHIVVPKKYVETCRAALKEAAEYISQFSYYDIDNAHIIPDIDVTEDFPVIASNGTPLQWSNDLITSKVDLSGTTLEFNTDTHYSSHWTAAVQNLFVSSGGYKLYVSGPPDIIFYKPDGSSTLIYSYTNNGSGT
jgi:hypothetical protein